MFFLSIMSNISPNFFLINTPVNLTKRYSLNLRFNRKEHIIIKWKQISPSCDNEPLNVFSTKFQETFLLKHMSNL